MPEPDTLQTSITRLERALERIASSAAQRESAPLTAEASPGNGEAWKAELAARLDALISRLRGALENAPKPTGQMREGSR